MLSYGLIKVVVSYKINFIYLDVNKICMKKIFIASDHGGYKAKEEIKKVLAKIKDVKVTDLGPVKEVKGDDYPQYAKKVTIS